MRSTEQIREQFLEYFEKKGHQRVASSSMIPAEDPTLMFVNAGMVQFKNVFLGLESREYKRATSSQKCLRISGKHNDFEAVGRTPRHHTFFEMLGNFSFGDYFKKDAIRYAWEFITVELGIDPEKLWVTIYEKDDEAGEIWEQETGIPSNRIVKLGEKDNFWSMGDVGPCGPCTEIHYDRGPSHACGDHCGLGLCECDRYTEVWNLVFMEYNRDESGTLTPLPKPSVDTGMGLERIVAVLQGVDSNYDTDLFRPLLRSIEKLTGGTYDPGENGFPYRVIADHIRSSSFLIADGILPSNEGRGYILRRIIRRAVRYGKTIGLSKPFLHTLVDTLIEGMGKAYPELMEKRDFVIKVLKVEEERFLETLSEGITLTENILSRMKGEGRTVMAGEEAFLLYDTFGFPVELTEDVLGEHGLSLDKDSFNATMAQHKDDTRKRSGKNDFKQNVALANAFVKLPETVFKGYETLDLTTSILGLFDLTGEPLSALESGEEAILISGETPFYGEAGGQIGDRGWLYQEDREVAEITDARKSQEGRIYHVIRGLGSLNQTGRIRLVVNEDRRNAVRRNHSATHLLHRALHEVLGKHATQKGSYVDEHYLRFDFSHFETISKEELDRIEDLVNQYILEHRSVSTELLPVSDAKKIGAMAIFGEKYGDTVRVVSMGDISKEFCGGTHVADTSHIGSFKIISESSIGAGLRRIEAYTGMGAVRNNREREEQVQSLSQLLKVPMGELAAKIQQIQREFKEQGNQLQKLQLDLVRDAAKSADSKLETVKDIPVIIEKVDGKSMEDLRSLADMYRDKLGSVLVVLGSSSEGKVNLLAAATKDLVSKGIHAGNIIKAIAPIVGGGGGGRPDMAQAGGKAPENLAAALAKARETI